MLADKSPPNSPTSCVARPRPGNPWCAPPEPACERPPRAGAVWPSGPRRLQRSRGRGRAPRRARRPAAADRMDRRYRSAGSRRAHRHAVRTGAGPADRTWRPGRCARGRGGAALSAHAIRRHPGQPDRAQRRVLRNPAGTQRLPGRRAGRPARGGRSRGSPVRRTRAPRPEGRAAYADGVRRASGRDPLTGFCGNQHDPERAHEWAGRLPRATRAWSSP